MTSKAAQVNESLSLYHSSLSRLRCGAVLATQGLITQVPRLWLDNLDISLVPAGDMARLFKCVSDSVTVTNVNGDLAPVLSNAQCRDLGIVSMSLSTTDTKCLVDAMVRGVREVWLDDVSLDMETLAQYDGQGECREVRFRADTLERYRAQVDVWAGYMGWAVSGNRYCYLIRALPDKKEDN